VDDEDLDLGPCCRCGKIEPPAQTLMMLPYRAPVPGTGWGCFQCGRPQDGATAVVCEACTAVLEAQRWTPTAPMTELQSVCYGNMGDGFRMPVAVWQQVAFNHDATRHPELAQPASAMPFEVLPTDTRFEGDDAEDACSRCGADILEDTVPILAMAQDGSFLYRYHPACVGMTTAHGFVEEDWEIGPYEEDDAHG